MAAVQLGWQRGRSVAEPTEPSEPAEPAEPASAAESAGGPEPAGDEFRTTPSPKQGADQEDEGEAE
jgi:hypothetical protein